MSVNNHDYTLPWGCATVPRYKTSNFKPVAHLLPEGFQVSQVIPHNLVNFAVVNLPVQVYEEVAETRHSLKAIRQLGEMPPSSAKTVEQSA